MSSRAVVSILFGMIMAGCGGGDDNSGPDAVSPACMEATTYQDLPTIEDKIFRGSCAGFSACHMGAALDAEELNLEVGRAHSMLVGVDGHLFPTYKRVAPGDPANSYIMIAIGQYPGPLGKLGTMPVNNALLCKEKRDAIERWIVAGALPN